MSIKYPVEKISGKSIPWILKKPQDDNREMFSYRLSYTDVNKYEGAVLENLADKFYGDPSLWHKIYEVNPPIQPDEYEEGMKIKIPITSSFREAPIVTSSRKVQ